MARLRISLSGNLSEGEGNITAAGEGAIRQLIDENPLLAADILRDWASDLDNWYWEARRVMDAQGSERD